MNDRVKDREFNETDAADMIIIARRAPLANMEEAAEVSALLNRFSAFIEKHFGEDDGPV